MRSILVHVNNDPGIESRLQIAFDLARSFDAHLTFVQAVAHNVAVAGDFSGMLSTQMIPVMQEQADEFRAEIEERLKDEDVRWDWVQEVGMADDSLLAHAALNDLVLVGSIAPSSSEMQPSRLAGALAIHGRTPVLVTPKDAEGFDPTKPVVVGWNGSPQSSHALRASIELLRKASEVILVEVIGEDDARKYDFPPSEAAEYLSRHGISCEIVEIPANGQHPGELIHEAAENREAGCLVMGAYGHARLFEMVFGGVTRKLLKDPTIPLFLAH